MRYDDFAYISGRIRILETQLLSQVDLDRMIDARSFHDAFRVLNELDYARFMDRAKKPEEFQKILDAELQYVKHLLETTTPSSWFLNIFWYQHDIHNIKTLLKAKLLGEGFESIEPLLVPRGSIDTRLLRAYILDGQNVSFLSHHEEEFKSTIREAKEAFDQKGNPKYVDFIIDRQYLRLAYDIAKKTGFPFVLNLVKHMIDLSNIKLYLRFQEWEDGDIADRGQFFKDHGHVAREVFFYPREKWNAAMERTPYAGLIRKSMGDFSTYDSFVSLENEVENFIVRYIRSYRFTAVGPETVVNYLLSKKNNAAITRLILICKLNNIPPEEIKRNLRALYSTTEVNLTVA